MLGTAPILTRLYTPDAFGLFSVISSAAMVLAAVLAFRLELAVPLPSADEDAVGLAKLALLVTLTTTSLSIVAMAFAGESIADWLGRPGDEKWMWWIPLLAALIATYSILNQVAIRQHRYAAIGRRNFAQQATGAGMQIGLGSVGAGTTGLIAGTAFGQGLGIATLLPGSKIFRRPDRNALRGASRRLLIRRYRRFPLFLAPSALLNNLGQQAPLLLFAVLYGSQVVGWLGLTMRVLAVPMAIGGLAIAQVYLSTLARTARATQGNEDRTSALFRATTLRLAIVAVVITAVTITAAPAAFAGIFGDEWAPSGLYARALAISFGAQLVASTLSQTLIVLERQRQQLAWDCARLAATTVAIVSAARLDWSPVAALWAFTVASSLSYAALWWLSWRAVKAQASKNRSLAPNAA